MISCVPYSALDRLLMHLLTLIGVMKSLQGDVGCEFLTCSSFSVNECTMDLLLAFRSPVRGKWLIEMMLRLVFFLL